MYAVVNGPSRSLRRWRIQFGSCLAKSNRYAPDCLGFLEIAILLDIPLRYMSPAFASSKFPKRALFEWIACNTVPGKGPFRTIGLPVHSFSICVASPSHAWVCTACWERNQLSSVTQKSIGGGGASILGSSRRHSQFEVFSPISRTTQR